MKKLLLGCTLATVASTSIFAQFTDKGYADLKLGQEINTQDAKSNIKVIKSEEEGDHAILNLKGVNLRLSVGEVDENTFTIYSISSTDKKARLAAYPTTELIGKNLTAVKKILGDKLQPLFGSEDEEEDDTATYRQYKFVVDKENYMSTCALFFDENEVLVEISTTYNP